MGLLYLNFLEPSGPLQACNGTALPALAGYTDCYIVEMELGRGSMRGNVKRVMQPAVKYWQWITHMDIEDPVK
jgi:hypothetical protein